MTATPVRSSAAAAASAARSQTPDFTKPDPDFLGVFDKHKFARQFEAFRPMLLRQARRSTNDANAAEDIVSNAVLTALSILDRFDPRTGGTGFASWLSSIVGFAALDWTNNQINEVCPLEGPEEIPENDDGGDDEEDSEHNLISRIRRADLKPREREFLTLYVFSGQTQQEIADAHEVSQQWVSKVIARAVVKVRAVEDEPSPEFYKLFRKLSKVTIYRKKFCWDRRSGERWGRKRCRKSKVSRKGKSKS